MIFDTFTLVIRQEDLKGNEYMADKAHDPNETIHLQREVWWNKDYYQQKVVGVDHDAELKILLVLINALVMFEEDHEVIIWSSNLWASEVPLPPRASPWVRSCDPLLV